MGKPRTADEALESLDRFINKHWPEQGDSAAVELYLAEPVLWIMTEAVHNFAWAMAQAAISMPIDRKSTGLAAQLLRTCATSLFIAARAGLQEELDTAKSRIEELEATLVEYRG